LHLCFTIEGDSGSLWEIRGERDAGEKAEGWLFACKLSESLLDIKITVEILILKIA